MQVKRQQPASRGVGAAGWRLIAAAPGKHKKIEKNPRKIGLAVRLPRRGSRSRGSRAELCLQRGDPDLQRLVLLAREPRHLLDGLELLALHHFEVAQDALGLGAHDGVELSPRPGRDTGRVVHQPRDLVEETVARLGHSFASAAP